MKTLTSKFKNIKSHFFCLLLGLIVSACGCDQVTDPDVNTVTNNITNNNIEDLRVRQPSVVDFLNLTVRHESPISVVVENIGNRIASSTTLRWYISLDPVIDSSDTEIGTNSVPMLAFEGLMITNIIVTTPNKAGVYYYGACVDTVIGEINTNNNCSVASGALVSRPDLTAVSISAKNNTLTTRNNVSLSVVINNIGYSSFDYYTTLFWYFSTDSTINNSDTEIDRASFRGLAEGESRVENHIAAVPQTPGVYYYGACTLRVTDEVNIANNCSVGARIEVGYPSDFILANWRATGLWSDGNTMWVADFAFGGEKIYAYDMLSKNRVANEDFNTLSAVGNTGATGLWSDGTTMWVLNSDFNDVNHKIYAYNMVTKAHDPSKDFNNILGTGYGGIWSDCTTMWVSVPSGGQTNDGDPKIYAYNMVTKARDPSKDFNTLPTNSILGGRYDATDIWSDGTTMWVANGSRGKIDAYDLLTKVRVPSKDFHSVAVNGGIWSDGYKMWTGGAGLSQYNALGLVTIPQYPVLKITNVIVNDIVLSNGQNITITANVNNSVAASSSTFLRFYGSTDSIIDHRSDLELGSNTIPNLLLGASETSSITVTAPNHFGTYYYGVCVDAVKGNSFRSCSAAIKVTISPTGTPTGDFHTLTEVGPGSNFLANGIWSDGVTVWIASWEYSTVYAYNLSNKVRNPSKDVNVEGFANSASRGIWADETTMWVGNTVSRKLHAFDLQTSEREESKDILLQGNRWITDICSDESTIWIRGGSSKIYAYNKMTKERDSSRDLDVIVDNDPGERYVGIWTDGITMWAANWNAYSHSSRVRILGYNVANNVRDPSKDIELGGYNPSGIHHPTDIWSDGVTMWVTDYWNDRVYAYSLETKQRVP